ncbi:MAG TPA: hypothetical protein VKB46_02100 [Pyrinomonadaceae bacterium]|nr:hypothetical protein [Pyrinomonadaceae bacterium]
MPGTQKSKTSEEIKERDSEATSKKTLREVQKSEKSFEAEKDDAKVPSPDGSFSEHEELKDSDPL